MQLETLYGHRLGVTAMDWIKKCALFLWNTIEPPELGSWLKIHTWFIGVEASFNLQNPCQLSKRIGLLQVIKMAKSPYGRRKRKSLFTLGMRLMAKLERVSIVLLFPSPPWEEVTLPWPVLAMATRDYGEYGLERVAPRAEISLNVVKSPFMVTLMTLR